MRRAIVLTVTFVVLAAAVRHHWLPGLGRVQVAADLLQAAETAIQENHLDEARQKLDECLQFDPENALAKVYRGQLFREAGDIDSARQMWQSISTHDDKTLALAEYLQGTVAMELGEVAASRDRFLEANRLDPTHLAARARLVEVYRMLRKSKELLSVLNELANLRPLTLQELVLRTVPQRSGYPPDESIRTLKLALRTSPNDQDLHFALSESLREKSAFQEAIESLQAIENSVLQDHALRSQLILAHLEAGNLQTAMQLCETVPATVSGDHHLTAACGQVAYAAGLWSHAARALRDVVRDDVNHRLHCFQLGRSLERLGFSAAAEALSERAVVLDELERLCLRISREQATPTPQAVPLIRQIVKLLFTLRREQEAIDWCLVGLRLAPRDVDLRAKLEVSQKSVSQEQPNPLAQLLPTATELARLANSTPLQIFDERGSGRTSSFSFVDVHVAAGLEFTYFNGKTGFEHLIESMGGGVLVVDFDSDGFADLYFPQGTTIPFNSTETRYHDRLMRNDAGRQFRDVTQHAVSKSYLYGLGGTVLDYNNDGFEDICVTNLGRNHFYVNNGDGTLTEIGSEIGFAEEEMSTSATSADFNNDSLPDLYLTNYVTELKVCPLPDGTYRPCDPSSFRGQPDRLFLNDGAGGFRDLSSIIAVPAQGGKGLGVLAVDLDSDQDIDIYVTNDGMPNFLFENTTPLHAETPVFVERALPSGVALDASGRAQAGMGLAIADFDQDQQLDLYVTNFYLEHNTLYRNEGHLIFSDATRRFNLFEATLPVLGFGVQADDFDLDGDADLLVANGHIFHDRTAEQPWKMTAQFFANQGNGRFEDVSKLSGDYFSSQSLGRGVATFDWNRDGSRDAVIVHQDRPPALLENRTPARHSVVQLRLVGTVSNRHGDGAVIYVHTGEGEPRIALTATGNYLSCNSRERQIVLPRTLQSLRLEILWPSGIRSSHSLEGTSSPSPSATSSTFIVTETGQSLAVEYQSQQASSFTN